MEYEKCFQPIMEKGASRNIVMAEDINLTIALNTLVEYGVIVGQLEMLSADVFYYLNPEKKNDPLRPIGLNNLPLFTPEERLKRPSDTREGRRELEKMGAPAGWGQVAVAPMTGRSGWGNA